MQPKRFAIGNEGKAETLVSQVLSFGTNLEALNSDLRRLKLCPENVVELAIAAP